MHRLPVPSIDEINQNFTFKGLESPCFKSFLGDMGATVLVHSQVTVLLGYLILHQRALLNWLPCNCILASVP